MRHLLSVPLLILLSLASTTAQAAGPHLVKDIKPGSASSTVTSGGGLNFSASATKLFFVADDGVHGAEPWVSDGTAAGTQLLADIVVGSNGSNPDEVVVAGSHAYFSPALWVSDGTPAGTSRVLDANSIYQTESLTAVGTSVFFDDHPVGAFGGPNLWVSAGTNASTQMLASYGTGNYNSVSMGFGANGTYFFGGWSSAAGTELWKSDGTAAGTALVADIRSGTTSSDPYGIVALDATTSLFTANDGAHGYELWKTDGTAAGTSLVLDIAAGATDSLSSGAKIRVIGARAFFVASDGTHGNELWTSNGTAAGTTMVKDIDVGSASGLSSDVYESGGVAYFSATDGTEEDIFKTDGTAAGTTKLAKLGVEANILEAVAFDNKLFFTVFNADGAQQTFDLWSTDGTALGTAPLAGPIYAVGLAASDHDLFFRSSDATNGSELWAIEASPVVSGSDGGSSGADGGAANNDGGGSTSGSDSGQDDGNGDGNGASSSGNGADNGGGCAIETRSSADGWACGLFGFGALFVFGRRRRR
jgi:ELWxxDGT repeat protein